MTRGEGLQRADIDSSLLTDPKLRRLRRQLPDAAQMARAVVLYLAALLDSWRTGERVSAEDAAPEWIEADAGTLAALVAADLLDNEYRVPLHAWTAWHDPAVQRISQNREKAQLGGLRARGARTRDEAEAMRAALNSPAISPAISATDTPASQPATPTGPSQPLGVENTPPAGAKTRTAKPSDDDERRREAAAAHAYELDAKYRPSIPTDPRPLRDIVAQLAQTGAPA